MSVMQLADLILRSVLGLIIGAGVGAVLGFVKFGLAEKLFPSGLFVVPSGPLLGALMMGLAGVVLGAITGVFRLRPFHGAALGFLIATLLMWRGMYSNLLGLATAIRQYFATGYLSRGSILMDLMTLSLAVDFAIIGAVVALSLRHLFALRR
jgi:hypothetical protein